jgi:hypothetical protein
LGWRSCTECCLRGAMECSRDTSRREVNELCGRIICIGLAASPGSHVGAYRPKMNSSIKNASQMTSSKHAFFAATSVVVILFIHDIPFRTNPRYDIPTSNPPPLYISSPQRPTSTVLILPYMSTTRTNEKQRHLRFRPPGLTLEKDSFLSMAVGTLFLRPRLSCQPHGHSKQAETVLGGFRGGRVPV